MRLARAWMLVALAAGTSCGKKPPPEPSSGGGVPAVAAKVDPETTPEFFGAESEKVLREAVARRAANDTAGMRAQADRLDALAAKASKARPDDPLPDLALARMARTTGDAAAEQAALKEAARKAPQNPRVADEQFLSGLGAACTASAEQALEADVEQWAAFVLEQEPGHTRPTDTKAPARPPVAPKGSVTVFPALAAALKAFAEGNMEEAARQAAAAEHDLVPPDPATALRILAGDSGGAGTTFPALRTALDARAAFEASPSPSLLDRIPATLASARALLSVAAAARDLSGKDMSDQAALEKIGDPVLRALAISSLAASPGTTPAKGLPMAEKALADIRTARGSDLRLQMAEGIVLLRLAEIETIGPARRERAKACLSWCETARDGLKTLHKFLEVRAMAGLLRRETPGTPGVDAAEVDARKAAWAKAEADVESALTGCPGCTACLTVRSILRNTHGKLKPALADMNAADKAGATALDFLSARAAIRMFRTLDDPKAFDAEEKGRCEDIDTVLRLRPDYWPARCQRVARLGSIHGTKRLVSNDEALRIAKEELFRTLATAADDVEAFCVLAAAFPLADRESEPAAHAAGLEILVEAAGTALKKHPDNLALLIRRADSLKGCAEALKESADEAPHVSGAIRDYTQIAKLDSGMSAPWDGLGRLRCAQAEASGDPALKVQKFEASIAAFDESLKKTKNKSPGVTTYNRATSKHEWFELQIQQKKPDRKLAESAIDDYTLAAKLDPTIASSSEIEVRILRMRMGAK